MRFTYIGGIFMWLTKKRFVFWAFALVVVFVFTACGGKSGSEAPSFTYFDNFTYELPPLPEGIKAQSEYYQKLKADWDEIFMDLRYYILSHGTVIIYNNNATIEYSINGSQVNFKVMDVMAVVNFKAFENIKKVFDVWNTICKTEGTTVWTAPVKEIGGWDLNFPSKNNRHIPALSKLFWDVTVGLYNFEGKRIGGYTEDKSYSFFNSVVTNIIISDRVDLIANFYVENKQKFLNEESFYMGIDVARQFLRMHETVVVPAKDIGDETGFTCKVDKIEWPKAWLKEIPKYIRDKVSLPPVMSYDDYIKEFK
jgi:hypothetical protein